MGTGSSLPTATNGGDETAPQLSIIIPAFNEEQRLAGSLRQVIDDCRSRSLTTEIIVVDDGSSDRTAAIVEQLMPACPALRLVRAVHGGKGHACRQGILAGRGSWLLLSDADLSVPITDIDRFQPHLEAGADIVIASREIAGAARVGEPSYRHLMGRAFNLVVRLLAVRGISDTQCGFKCFRRPVAQRLCGLQTINGWGFDVELLFVAQRHGYSIIEVPVTWYYRDQSKVSPIRDALRMLREVWQIRQNAWRGRYELSSPDGQP